MTEAEWLTCTEPAPMLEYLQRRASKRKLRLFACACCRRILHLSYPGQQAADQVECSKQAVETAELAADGLATAEQLAASFRACERGTAGRACAQRSAWSAAKDAANHCGWSVYWFPGVSHPDEAGKSREGAAQAGLVRDLFGNPFRPVARASSVLVWKDGTVQKLAAAIYDGRCFGDLPILADALEEAGCDNADLLAHFRGGGEHVRGCWAVDALLGKG